jgi:hypothetical protein
VVGDTAKDAIMGMKMSLRTIMLMTGKIPKEGMPKDLPVKKDLSEAVDHILTEDGP